MPKIDIDSETGDFYAVENPPTKADWILGGFWFVFGVFALMWEHVRGQIRGIRGW